MYFSGTLKSILTGLSCCTDAIISAGLTLFPSLTFFKPITPLKGARISVFAICACVKSISALVCCTVDKAKSYSS